MISDDPNQNFDQFAGAANEEPRQEKVVASSAVETAVEPPETVKVVLEATKVDQPKAPEIQQQRLPQERKELKAEQGGLLIGSTFEEQWRIATAYSSSGLMPRGLDTPQKVLVAMQLCRELQLPAVSSIGKVMVLNGTPSIFGDLPLALVRRSGLLESIKETWLKGSDGSITGARCTVHRKGEGDPVEREFTVADAKVAGLWGKTGQSGKPSPWVLYPTRMLQMRARSWALKDTFADVLGGVSIAEYDLNATIGDKGEVFVESETQPTGASKLASIAAEKQQPK